MGRFAIRGLLSRKLRTALTAIAIVLGVAMISGTYVLTDSIDQAFDRIFTDIRQGSNAVISGRSAVELSDGSGVDDPTFDESLLDEVRELPGVAQAEGSVDSDATQLIGDDGKAVVFGGAPNLGFSIADPNSRFNPLTLIEGDWPGPDEVIVDKETAAKEDFEVGETIGVQAEGPVEQFRIAGIMQFSSGLSIGGATLAGFDLPTAQRVMRREGQLNEIAVASAPGVSDPELVRQIREILPDGTQVRGVGEQVDEDAEDTNEFITFLQGFLLAFGGIALFVGSFVIANSLSITIAQRTREFATLRTLGASRRQVLGSILAESLIVGVVASVDRSLCRTASREGSVPSLRRRWLHAPEHRSRVRNADGRRRASRRHSRHARRESASRDPRNARTANCGRARGLHAAARPVRAVPLDWRAADDGRRLRRVALWPLRERARHDADPHLDGTRRTSDLPRRRALLVTPRTSAGALLGWPAARIGGAAGFLARDNARRNPQRTASTAAALMIGLALVTLVATLAAGIVTSFREPSKTSSPATTRSPPRTTSRRSRSTRPRRLRRRRA